MTTKVWYDWAHLDWKWYSLPLSRTAAPNTVNSYSEVKRHSCTPELWQMYWKRHITSHRVAPEIQKQGNKQKLQEFIPRLGISQWILLTGNGTTPIPAPHLYLDRFLTLQGFRNKLHVISEDRMCAWISVYKYNTLYCLRVYRVHVIYINSLNHDNSSMR